MLEGIIIKLLCIFCLGLLHIHIMESYARWIMNYYGVSGYQFLARTNVLVVLLEYIDLFWSKWQQETNIWEGLPFPIPFYIAVFHFKYIAIAVLIIFCSDLLCFCLPIIPIILLAKLMHPYTYDTYQQLLLHIRTHTCTHACTHTISYLLLRHDRGHFTYA